jgi:carbamoyl-phosphate synthase large subunit
MNILLTSAGRRVSLVRAFQRELRKHFPQGMVYTVDLHPDMAAACVVSDGAFAVHRVAEPGYIDQLLDLCRARGIRMVVPTIDTELMVLAEHKDRFLAQGVALVVSSPSLIAICHDKRKTAKFLAANGIATPSPIDKHNITYPLFIKPYDGSLSKDTFLVRQPDELTAWHLNNEKFMFMEYMSKDEYDEYTVDMYYGSDNLLKCIVPRKRLEVRGGEISKGLTVKNHIIETLKNRLGSIDGAVGCLTLQLFLNRVSERIVAIEINARFGGGFPLSYQAGANYPGWLICEHAYHETISYTDDWQDGVRMLRYDDEVIVRQSD